MPILKSLTFTSVPTRSHDPVAIRRAKLVSRLEEQRLLLQNPSYVRTVQRWAGKGDERRQVEKQQRVRPWWRADSAGNLVMSVYYGAKPIEFEKARPASRSRPGTSCRRSWTLWSAPRRPASSTS